MLKSIKVINLDRRDDRLNAFYSQFNLTNLKDIGVERYSAIDGKDLKNEIINKGLTNDPIFEVLRNLNKDIASGELGCLLSHYFLLKSIKNDNNLNSNDYVVIFEDDIFLQNTDTKKCFLEIDEFVKNNQVDLIYISGRWTHNFMAKQLKSYEKKSDHIYQRIDGGGYDWDRCAPAYICTKLGAEKLYNKVLHMLKNSWVAIDNIFTIQMPDTYNYDFFPHLYHAVRDYQTDIQGEHLKNKIHTKNLCFDSV